MRPNPNRGRVYRRCGCRDEHGRQLGARCPRLANPRHGCWAFAVDMPALDRKRKTMRRSGYDTRSEARAALARVLECERAGCLPVRVCSFGPVGWSRGCLPSPEDGVAA